MTAPITRGFPTPEVGKKKWILNVPHDHYRDFVPLLKGFFNRFNIAGTRYTQPGGFKYDFVVNDERYHQHASEIDAWFEQFVLEPMFHVPV